MKNYKQNFLMNNYKRNTNIFFIKNLICEKCQVHKGTIVGHDLMYPNLETFRENLGI